MAENIKIKAARGAMWKGLERIFAQMISTVVSIVLARILVPADYSIVSIVAIFFNFCDLFISGGLNTALIQMKNADIDDYSTVLWINLIMATVMYCLMFFGAPYIAKLYGKALLVPVIRVMALTFFINGYKAVLCAKVSAELQFKKFFWATFGGTLISGIVGIAMAVKGAGAWALVAQQMTNSFIDSLMLTFFVRLKIKFFISKERFKRLFSFGGKIFVANIINTAYNNLRPLIVGIKFSPTELAFYKKGEGFPSLVNSIFSNTMSAVLLPAMSKLQDDRKAMLAALRRYIKTCSFVTFPAMLGFFAVSDNFIKVILTEKWIDAAPYIRIFCIVYMLDLIQIGNVSVIQALGRTDITLKTEIIKKSIYTLIVVLAVVFSNSALLLAASCILCSIVATIVNVVPTMKYIDYGYKKLMQDTIGNLIPSVLMSGVVNAMNKLLLNMYVLLLLQVIVGAVLYVLLCAISKNQNLNYVLRTVKEIRNKGKV